MFTGIIEELGQVKSALRKGSLLILSIQTDKAAQDTKVGDSIAVNGVCLTVVKKAGSVLSFELLEETAKLTNLGKASVGEKVNVERSLKVGDRLCGHFVTGHIDCLGLIRAKSHKSGNLCFEITLKSEFLKFIVPKGSVAIDGISLTVVNKHSNAFAVYVIPHTLCNTTLSFKGPSSVVNMERDILAKFNISAFRLCRSLLN